MILWAIDTDGWGGECRYYVEAPTINDAIGQWERSVIAERYIVSCIMVPEELL